MTIDNKTPSAVWAEQESAKEMQPFYKTLADVQPGGRVRLATVPYDRARDLIGDAYNAGTHGIGYSQQAMELHDAIIPVRRSPATCKDGLQVQPSPGGQDALVEEALEYFERAGDAGDRKYVAAIRAALAAQPSPGGQGDALAKLCEKWEAAALHGASSWHYIAAMRECTIELKAALAARQPVTMDDALAAGDGTLHGAIDHWQERALRAEDELAARQPVAGLSWADYWMERGQPDVAHDFDAFSRAEAWALQRFPAARQPVGEPVAKSVGIDALVRLLEDEAAECEKAWTKRADTYMSGRASGFLLAADHFRKIATSQRWSEFLSSPAQAVDLGQIWQQAFNDTAHSYRRNKSRMWVLQMLKERVQALIDSHSVGGQP